MIGILELRTDHLGTWLAQLYRRHDRHPNQGREPRRVVMVTVILMVKVTGIDHLREVLR